MNAGPNRRTEAPPNPEAAPDSALWVGDDMQEDRSRWTGVTVSVLLHVLVIGVIALAWYLYQTPQHDAPPSVALSADNEHTAAAAARTDTVVETPPIAAAVSSPEPAPAAAQPATETPAALTSAATANPPPPPPVHPVVRPVRHAASSRVATASSMERQRDPGASQLPRSRDPLLAWPRRPPVLAPPTETRSDEGPPESRDPLLGSEPADAALPESRDPLLAHRAADAQTGSN